MRFDVEIDVPTLAAGAAVQGAVAAPTFEQAFAAAFAAKLLSAGAAVPPGFAAERSQPNIAIVISAAGPTPPPLLGSDAHARAALSPAQGFLAAACTSCAAAAVLLLAEFPN